MIPQSHSLCTPTIHTRTDRLKTEPTGAIPNTAISMDFASGASSMSSLAAAAAGGGGGSGGGGWAPLLDSALGQGASTNSSKPSSSSSSSLLLPIQSTETPALASPYLDPYSVGCWFRLGDEVEDLAMDVGGEGSGVGGVDAGHREGAVEVVGSVGQQQQQEAGGQGQGQRPPRDPSRLWPCQRSLHAAAVLGDVMYIFGGG